MKQTFLLQESDSTYYHSNFHPLFSTIILEEWGKYFSNSGLFHIELGCSNVEHTVLLAKAYENTWIYLRDNQKELLSIILKVSSEEAKYMWEYEANIIHPDYYKEKHKIYKQLQNINTLNNYISIDRIIFVPNIINGLCNISIRFSPISINEEQQYDVSPFWIVLETNKTIFVVEEAGGDMDNILYKHIKNYIEYGIPLYYPIWKPQEKSMKIVSNTDFPISLGRGGTLTKFEKLAPHLTHMCIEAVSEEKIPFYTAPRSVKVLGDYGIEQLYIIRKIVGKKWEDSPVFYADLRFQEVVPLAENLVSFLKLGCMVGSFLAVAGAVDTTVSEYRRYLKGMPPESDSANLIDIIEKKFSLPQIEDVHTYVNNLQKNKELIEMGKKLYRQFHKKRGWDDPED